MYWEAVKTDESDVLRLGEICSVNYCAANMQSCHPNRSLDMNGVLFFFVFVFHPCASAAPQMSQRARLQRDKSWEAVKEGESEVE